MKLRIVLWILGGVYLGSVLPVLGQPQPITLAPSSRLTVPNAQGQSQTLRIVAVELALDDPELLLYSVDRLDPTSRVWENLCNPDAEGRQQAIALSGHWDSTGAYTQTSDPYFSCTSGAIAKCVLMGYAPWKTLNGQSLHPYHQACIRMIRADYCGDGSSYTQDGTVIDVYDRLELMEPTVDSGMTFEAAWGPEGAVWINRTRFPDTWHQLQEQCPNKLQGRISPNNLLKTYTEIRDNFPEALLFNDSF